jgi:hypothetical protein
MLSESDIEIAINKGWSISPSKSIYGPIEVTDLSIIPSDLKQISPRVYDFRSYSGDFKSTTLPCKSSLAYFTGTFRDSTNLRSAFSNIPLIEAEITLSTNSFDCANMFSGYSSQQSIITFTSENGGNISYAHSMFYGSYVKEVVFDNVNISGEAAYMFYGTVNLTKITMTGDTSNIIVYDNMFTGINPNGTFYYNPDYDYSKIIAVLPSTWTAVPLK